MFCSWGFANNSNINKKVIYRTFVTNNYPATPTGGSFNQLINSGIVHPTGVLIVPFLGAVTGTIGLGDNRHGNRHLTHARLLLPQYP